MLHIHQITSHWNARSDSFQEIRIATQGDDELALLKHTITSGCQSTTKEVPSEIQPYWTFNKELTVEDGIILKGTHICYTPTGNIMIYSILFMKDIWVLISKL